MNCEEIQNHIDDFLRGNLNPAEEEEVVRHIASCPPCRFVYQERRQELDNLDHPDSAAPGTKPAS